MKIITLIFLLISFCTYSQLTLDTNFANNGFLDYTGMKSAQQLGTDSSERIVCWGETTSNQPAILRFLPNGVIDNSFGTNGSVNIQYQSSSLNLNSILVLSTDDILFFGKTNGNFADLIVGKLTSNGDLDTTFGNNGYFSFPSTFQRVTPISLVESNGKFLIASLLVDGNFDTFNTVLVKINADGTIDQTFADNGSKITLIKYGIFCTALAVDGIGNIYISGDDDMQYFYISKYTSNGLLDAPFGTNGEVVGLLNDHAKSYSLQLTEDKILVFGTTDGMQTNKTAAAKFNLNTGSFLGAEYLYQGAERFDGGFASYQFDDGKFLIGGSLSFQASGGPQITRFLKVDTDFSSESSLTVDFYPTDILAYARQGSKVLAAGQRSNNLFIMRINDGPLGVNQFEKNTDFSIYPNPSSLNFEIKSLEPIMSVKIFDKLGKELKTYNGQADYDISNFSPGVYFVLVKTESKSEIKKLIIK